RSEGEDRSVPDLPGRADAREALGGDQHQLLSERVKRFESLGGKRLGHERSLDVAAEDPSDQRAGGAGNELEANLGIRGVITRQHLRQARRRGALERAEGSVPRGAPLRSAAWASDESRSRRSA